MRWSFARGPFLAAAACLGVSAATVPGAIAAVPSSSTVVPDQGAAAPAPAISAPDGSFDVGLVIGNQLASSGLTATLSRADLQRGLDAALGGKIPSNAQKDTAQQFMRTARIALADRNVAAAHAFLEKNGREKGIETLASGLQYRVLAAGDPQAPPPGPQDQVTVRYRTSLIDGTEIDRSDDHPGPATFKLITVIRGWREALAAMHPGARWQVFVPPELGYGANSPPPIPPGSLLVYELELLQVEAAKPLQPKPTQP